MVVLAGNLISENYIMTDHYSTPNVELPVNLSTKETDLVRVVVVESNIQQPPECNVTRLNYDLDTEEDLI